MARDDLEHEPIAHRASFAERMRLGRLRSHHRAEGVGGLFEGIERRVRGLETWQLVVGGVALVAVVDWAIAPKGMSFAAKAWDKLGGAKALPPPPPPPPPPPALTPAQVAAKGDWTGANAQAGWNRGMSPYGGWALNAPAGPWPYAHAQQPGYGDGNWGHSFGMFAWE